MSALGNYAVCSLMLARMFVMTSAFVRQLGITGVAGDRGVVRYRESEFLQLCEALVAHVRTVHAKQQKAA